MENSLLTTKLYIPPPRTNLVPRSRLVKLLNEGLHRKLTLISAPAGFGKTTLVTDWLSQLAIDKYQVAWISLDEGDNDLSRFLNYLIAALQTIEASIGETALAVLQSPEPPPIEAVLTFVINDIVAYGRGCVLVLDDFHFITAPAVHECLTFLVDHLPPQAHLMITTRIDPSLPLARLRANGRITDLRAADLRFTEEENATFLNHVMGLNLSPEQISVLDSRAEGWIAGLQMAALSITGKDNVDEFIAGFSSSNRHILDYLTEEVINQQPQTLQRFLLQTAVLDRLCGSLCEAVTGRDGGQETLENLENANLFLIPLDDERRWYRYHHLFADLLKSRLGKTQLDQVPALHHRASEWYEQKGLVTEAVSHALAAGDVKRLSQLIEGKGLAMMDRVELATLVGQLDGLPEEEVRSLPWLCVAHAWVLVYAGQLDTVESHLKDAEKAVDGSDRHIAGHIAAIRAYGADLVGDKLLAAEFARESLELLPEDDLKARGSAASLLSYALYWSGDLEAATQASAKAVALSRAAGDSHVAVNILCELTRLQISQGQLHKAINTCEEALQLTNEYADQGRQRLPIAGYIYANMSHVLYEWNELGTALNHARDGLELCKQWGQSKALFFAYISLTKALQASGDVDSSLDAIREARQFMHEVSPWYEAAMRSHQANLLLAQGDVAAAIRWVQERGLDIDKELSLPQDHEYLTLARVLIAQGRRSPEKEKAPIRPLMEALRLLARLLRLEEAAGAMGRIIEILVLQAMALQAQSEGDQALVPLEHALTLAEPEGYVRIFIDEGAPMGELLRQAASRGIAVDFASRLLAALEKDAKKDLRMTETLSPKMESLLSERELEVLRYLNTHLSSTEIAVELYLSVNTVRFHIKNIYGKLNVHRRTAAVQRAKELGLI